MNKFKILFMVLFVPTVFILYYFTSFEHGINALLDKKSQLTSLKKHQKLLELKIEKIKTHNKLLNSTNPDLDFLEEKSIEILGKSKKDLYHIFIVSKI